MRTYAEADIRRVDCERILKSRLYSEYRQWRVFGELANDSVAAATFSADSRKVWIGGGGGDGYNSGGSIRLHDMYSTVQLGFWEVDRSIDGFVAPALPDTPFILTTTAVPSYEYDFSFAGRSRIVEETALWRTGMRGGEFFLDHANGPAVMWENLARPVLSASGLNMCGIPSPFQPHIDGCYATIYDTGTGVEIASFRREGWFMGTYASPYVAPNACFGLGVGGENIVLAAGILWDCRTGGIIGDFDKLSTNGFGVFHPNGNSLLVDNAVWDIRRFSLLETVKQLEDAQSHFCTDGNGSVLLACSPYSSVAGARARPSSQNSCFHALDASDYSLIHTQHLDTDEVVLLGGTGALQSDPCGLGYVLSVEGRVNHMFDISESCCRVLEIGRRKPNYQDDEADDAQTEDEEWDLDHREGTEEDEENSEEELDAGSILDDDGEEEEDSEGYGEVDDDASRSNDSMNDRPEEHENDVFYSE